MELKYQIPAGYYRVQQEIQKSRFITHIGHAPTKEDALEFIHLIRKEHPRATHNCWAYIAGAPGRSMAIGMSDDGEPHGTAGPPILQVLQHCSIGEIVAVVTRYYGGIKLGTGGLVRAYAGSVSLALETLPLGLHEELSQADINIPYADESSLRKLLDSNKANILSLDYGNSVRLTIELPTSKRSDLESIFNERLTHGSLNFKS